MDSSARAVVFTLLATLALCAGVAHAQPTVAHATDEQKEAARTAYQEGKLAFEAGDFATALERFRAADADVSSPNTSLMVGRCLAALGQRAEAYITLARVVRDAHAWGDRRYADAADAATRELDALRPELAMVEVAIDDSASNAELYVGGRAIPRDAWYEAVPADPGSIEVILRAADGREQRTELELQAGVAATVTLALPPAETQSEPPEPEPLAAPAPAPAPAPEPPAEASSSGPGVLPYVLAGVGLAGIAAFSVLGSMSNSKYDEIESECPTKRGCDPELRDLADDGKRLQTMANIALVAGGVALAAGATLFVLELGGADDQLSMGVTPAGAHLRGRF